MQDPTLYQPSKWQREYHQLVCEEALGAGAAGPGKSLCLLMDPIQTQLMTENARLHGDPSLAGFDESHVMWDIIKNNPIKPGHSQGRAIHFRRTFPRLEETLSRAHLIFKAIQAPMLLPSCKRKWV